MNQFPIRVLSEKTGVAPTTLRAWERRYGLLKPLRTPKGHRLYSPADVKTVLRVVSMLEENYTISKAINAIRLNEARAQQPRGRALSHPEDNRETATHWDNFIQRFLKAIELFDDNKLEAVYNEALSLYPIDIVTSNLLRPLLQMLGKQWEEKGTGIAEEHFFSAYLRNKVGARMHHASNRGQGNRLLLACLPHEFHELGILLFGLSAMSRGYRILFLGSDLPINQISPVLGTTSVDAIILSGSSTTINAELAMQLNELAASIDIPLMLGGNISDTPDNKLSVVPDGRITLLGNDYPKALIKLEATLPAYNNF